MKDGRVPASSGCLPPPTASPQIQYCPHPRNPAMSPHMILQAPVTLTSSVENRGQNFNMSTKKIKENEMNKTNYNNYLFKGKMGGGRIHTNTLSTVQ